MQATEFNVGHQILDFQAKTYIMGILNVTPDSFSDGGKFLRVAQAVDHAAEMIENGADMIDIGGESTRPGFEQVPVEEELERVLPVIQAISSRFDIPISIDTYKAQVARLAIEAGAHIINDVWGAKADDQMAHVAAELEVPIILMHNRKERNYTDLIQDIIQDLQESVSIARQAGVKEEKIILDPGIGFAKTWRDNLVVMNHLEKIVALNYPVLLGTSRKSMIGKVLDVPVEERLEGTLATVCLGIAKGCHIMRIHDVKEIARAAKMMDAMLGRAVIEQHG